MPRTAPSRARSAPVCAGAGVLLAALLSGCGGDPGEPAAQRLAAERTDARPASAAPAATAAPSTSPTPVPVVERGDGDLDVVPGTGAVVGTGEVAAYVVEVEGGLGVDPAGFAQAVEAVLSDPRSWSSGGRRALQRVGGGDVDFRVALASPETTDRLCSPLDTGGYYSCANGERAVVNAARWLTGAPTYAGRLDAYRQYLLNHEVGHTLGFGHADCPGSGEVAPVMLQQSKSLDGCDQNPWPYPSEE